MGLVEIATLIFGGGGMITGLIALFHAKPNKDRIDAETFQAFCDEMQETFNKEREEHHKNIEELKAERELQKKDSAEYRAKTDKKISELFQKLDIHTCAVNSAYRCPLPSNIDDCPVIATLNRKGA